MKVSFNLSNDEKEVVRQGENMSPVIFLFYIHLAMLLVRKQARLQDVEEIEFKIPLARKNLGKLNNHTKVTQGTTMIVPELLYVDDGMLNMTNREDLIKMSSIVKKQIARIGLQMHVGGNGKPSKSVAMYFPPSAKEIPEELTEQE